MGEMPAECAQPPCAISFQAWQYRVQIRDFPFLRRQ
jgi:hypothetical protein